MSDGAEKLPPNWEVQYTPKGKKYYVDHNTQKTQWDPPVANSSSLGDLASPPSMSRGSSTMSVSSTMDGAGISDKEMRRQRRKAREERERKIAEQERQKAEEDRLQEEMLKREAEERRKREKEEEKRRIAAEEEARRIQLEKEQEEERQRIEKERLEKEALEAERLRLVEAEEQKKREEAERLRKERMAQEEERLHAEAVAERLVLAAEERLLTEKKSQEQQRAFLEKEIRNTEEEEYLAFVGNNNNPGGDMVGPPLMSIIDDEDNHTNVSSLTDFTKLTNAPNLSGFRNRSMSGIDIASVNTKDTKGGRASVSVSRHMIQNDITPAIRTPYSAYLGGNNTIDFGLVQQDEGANNVDAHSSRVSLADNKANRARRHSIQIQNEVTSKAKPDKIVDKLSFYLASSELQILASDIIPIMQSDQVRKTCLKCDKKFGMFQMPPTKKHHCKSCGELFCSNCAGHKMKLTLKDSGEEYSKPVTVCDFCLKHLSTGDLNCVMRYLLLMSYQEPANAKPEEKLDNARRIGAMHALYKSLEYEPIKPMYGLQRGIHIYPGFYTNIQYIQGFENFWDSVLIHLTSRTNGAILDYACKIIAASFPRIDDIKDVAPFFTKGGVVNLIRVGLQDSTANSSAAFALFKCLERHPVVGLQLKSFIANPDLLTTLVKSMAAPDTSNSVRILLVEVLGLLLGSTKSTALVTVMADQKLDVALMQYLGSDNRALHKAALDAVSQILNAVTNTDYYDKVIGNVFKNKVVEDAFGYLQWERNGFFHVKTASNMLAGFTNMDDILGTVEYSALCFFEVFSESFKAHEVMTGSDIQTDGNNIFHSIGHILDLLTRDVYLSQNKAITSEDKKTIPSNTTSMISSPKSRASLNVDGDTGEDNDNEKEEAEDEEVEARAKNSWGRVVSTALSCVLNVLNFDSFSDHISHQDCFHLLRTILKLLEVTDDHLVCHQCITILSHFYTVILSTESPAALAELVELVLDSGAVIQVIQACLTMFEVSMKSSAMMTKSNPSDFAAFNIMNWIFYNAYIGITISYKYSTTLTIDEKTTQWMWRFNEIYDITANSEAIWIAVSVYAKRLEKNVKADDVEDFTPVLDFLHTFASCRGAAASCANALKSIEMGKVLESLTAIVDNIESSEDLMEMAMLCLGSLGGAPAYFRWELQHLASIAHRLEHEDRAIEYSALCNDLNWATSVPSNDATTSDVTFDATTSGNEGNSGNKEGSNELPTYQDKYITTGNHRNIGSYGIVTGYEKALIIAARLRANFDVKATFPYFYEEDAHDSVKSAANLGSSKEEAPQGAFNTPIVDRSSAARALFGSIDNSNNAKKDELASHFHSIEGYHKTVHLAISKLDERRLIGSVGNIFGANVTIGALRMLQSVLSNNHTMAVTEMTDISSDNSAASGASPGIFTPGTVISPAEQGSPRRKSLHYHVVATDEEQGMNLSVDDSMRSVKRKIRLLLCKSNFSFAEAIPCQIPASIIGVDVAGLLCSSTEALQEIEGSYTDPVMSLIEVLCKQTNLVKSEDMFIDPLYFRKSLEFIARVSFIQRFHNFISTNKALQTLMVVIMDMRFFFDNEFWDLDSMIRSVVRIISRTASNLEVSSFTQKYIPLMVKIIPMIVNRMRQNTLLPEIQRTFTLEARLLTLGDLKSVVIDNLSVIMNAKQEHLQFALGDLSPHPFGSLKGTVETLFDAVVASLKTKDIEKLCVDDDKHHTLECSSLLKNEDDLDLVDRAYFSRSFRSVLEALYIVSKSHSASDLKVSLNSLINEPYDSKTNQFAISSEYAESQLGYVQLQISQRAYVVYKMLLRAWAYGKSDLSQKALAVLMRSGAGFVSMISDDQIYSEDMTHMALFTPHLETMPWSALLKDKQIHALHDIVHKGKLNKDGKVSTKVSDALDNNSIFMSKVYACVSLRVMVDEINHLKPTDDDEEYRAVINSLPKSVALAVEQQMAGHTSEELLAKLREVVVEQQQEQNQSGESLVKPRHQYFPDMRNAIMKLFNDHDFIIALEDLAHSSVQAAGLLYDVVRWNDVGVTFCSPDVINKLYDLVLCYFDMKEKKVAIGVPRVALSILRRISEVEIVKHESQKITVALDKVSTMSFLSSVMDFHRERLCDLAGEQHMHLYISDKNSVSIVEDCVVINSLYVDIDEITTTENLPESLPDIPADVQSSYTSLCLGIVEVFAAKIKQLKVEDFTVLGPSSLADLRLDNAGLELNEETSPFKATPARGRRKSLFDGVLMESASPRVLSPSANNVSFADNPASPDDINGTLEEYGIVDEGDSDNEDDFDDMFRTDSTHADIAEIWLTSTDTLLWKLLLYLTQDPLLSKELMSTIRPFSTIVGLLRAATSIAEDPARDDDDDHEAMIDKCLSFIENVHSHDKSSLAHYLELADNHNLKYTRIFSSYIQHAFTDLIDINSYTAMADRMVACMFEWAYDSIPFCVHLLASHENFLPVASRTIVERIKDAGTELNECTALTKASASRIIVKFFRLLTRKRKRHEERSKKNNQETTLTTRESDGSSDKDSNKTEEGEVDADGVVVTNKEDDDDNNPEEGEGERVVDQKATETSQEKDRFIALRNWLALLVNMCRCDVGRAEVLVHTHEIMVALVLFNELLSRRKSLEKYASSSYFVSRDRLLIGMSRLCYALYPQMHTCYFVGNAEVMYSKGRAVRASTILNESSADKDVVSPATAWNIPLSNGEYLQKDQCQKLCHAAPVLADLALYLSGVSNDIHCVSLALSALQGIASHENAKVFMSEPRTLYELTNVMRSLIRYMYKHPLSGHATRETDYSKMQGNTYNATMQSHAVSKLVSQALLKCATLIYDILVGHGSPTPCLHENTLITYLSIYIRASSIHNPNVYSAPFHNMIGQILRLLMMDLDNRAMLMECLQSMNESVVSEGRLKGQLLTMDVVHPINALCYAQDLEPLIPQEYKTSTYQE